MHSVSEPDAVRNARAWVHMLWNTPCEWDAGVTMTNFLYAFAILALSGQYRREW